MCFSIDMYVGAICSVSNTLDNKYGLYFLCSSPFCVPQFTLLCRVTCSVHLNWHCMI
jgi:hypothetical protein